MRKALFIILFASMLLFSFIMGRMSVNPQIVNLEGSYDLFKTVAHIDLSQYDYLKCVYMDGDNDVAYYMYTGDHTQLKAGDLVYAPYGEKFEVLSVDAIGFLITACEDETAVKVGFSGMGILDANGKQLGAISYLQGDNIYCIWT